MSENAASPLISVRIVLSVPPARPTLDHQRRTVRIVDSINEVNRTRARNIKSEIQVVLVLPNCLTHHLRRRARGVHPRNPKLTIFGIPIIEITSIPFKCAAVSLDGCPQTRQCSDRSQNRQWYWIPKLRRMRPVICNILRKL